MPAAQTLLAPRLSLPMLTIISLSKSVEAERIWKKRNTRRSLQLKPVVGYSVLRRINVAVTLPLLKCGHNPCLKNYGWHMV
jgi:hypothetical protein